MSSEFVWMTVTGSWTATVLNVDTDNDIMEISNFEEPTSTNGHKTTKYADVAGTDGRTVLETPLRSLVFFSRSTCSPAPCWFALAAEKCFASFAPVTAARCEYHRVVLIPIFFMVLELLLAT